MLEIIVAVDQEGGFGKEGKIPWHHSEDLKHFKEITADGICLMGRNTYIDMLEMRRVRDIKHGKTAEPIKEILPNRLSIVITSSPHQDTPGALTATSIDEALEMVDGRRRIFVIGGERMYVEALPMTGIVHRTVVPGWYNCDKFFPTAVLEHKFTVAGIKEENSLTFYTHVRIEE